MASKLFLIPQLLSPENPESQLPSGMAALIMPIRFFIVEEEKAARRFLRQVIPQFPLSECRFFLFNEHTSREEIGEYFAVARDADVGVISEAGCPCMADPGAEVVLAAHKKGREVVPLVGPSSILLALMASGLNGQRFVFHGYLPKDRQERVKKIKDLERRARNEGQTQIFMETPYRNQHLFEDILLTCDSQTFLCVAIDLCSPSQCIRTRRVQEWRVVPSDLHKRQALFLLGMM